MPLLFLAPATMAAASRKTSNTGIASWLANYSMSYHELKIPAATHHLYAHRIVHTPSHLLFATIIWLERERTETHYFPNSNAT